MADYTKEIEKKADICHYFPSGCGKDDADRKIPALRGAINLAGSVKGKATARHAVSDWMEIEKERGISVTSSVLQFNYDGYCINILDTPGHQDFSEDTYRTLMAADSAVMVIDGSKGLRHRPENCLKSVSCGTFRFLHLSIKWIVTRTIPSICWMRSKKNLGSQPVRSTGRSDQENLSKESTTVIRRRC